MKFSPRQLSQSLILFCGLSGIFNSNLCAQQTGWVDPGYDDYKSFSADPEELDEEVSRVFGRFFQTSLNFGTGIFTGDHGDTHSSGSYLGLRFIYFVDKYWATELAGAYVNHSATYKSEDALGKKININLDTTMNPVSLGLRFGFDRERLARGFSAMNPYIAAAGEIFFRTETVQGSPTIDGVAKDLKSKYTSGAINNSTAYGFNVGGGFEFDVYKNKIFLGVDGRYHQIFWPDSTVLLGTQGRNGNYVTILGSFTYSY